MTTNSQGGDQGRGHPGAGEAAQRAGRAPADLRRGRPGLLADGAVSLGGHSLPYSALASSAARQAFIHEIGPPPPEAGSGAADLRAYYAAQNERLANRMGALFAVEVREDVLGGVRVHVVTPKGPSAAGGGRTLICLHGGAFTWGADSGALVEAIPIAAATGAEVVAVDYRMGPEHVFPAASEDVGSVYRALLESRRPEALAIYGCSAGAILTAQAVAWILRLGLPRPGCIAMLGGGAGDLAGDSVHMGPAMEGLPAPAGPPLSLAAFAYFAGASLEDPCVSPGAHDATLRQFPPTLLIGGGRDFALSSLTDLHLRLDALGVDARLYVFDGLWHAFHIYPDLPESVRVYEIMARFFDRNLLV